MPGGDWGYLAGSLTFAALVLAASEGLRRRGWAAESSRKFVHIAVGHVAIPLVLLVQNQWLAVLPAVAFVLINYGAWKTGALPGMDAARRGTLGTVYFPAALALLLLLLWAPGHRALVLGAMMLMTWGDGLAAVLGSRLGRRRWQIAGDSKSLEGSLVMFGAGFAALFLSLWASARWVPSLALRFATGGGGIGGGPGAALSTGELLALSLLLALVATLLEAVSARGLDNLSVPLGSAAVGLALLRQGPAGMAALTAGLVGAAAVGWLAARKGALTASGALGATLVGSLIFGLGGPLWGLLLIAFFVSSSLLTHHRQREKESLGEKFAKTGARDAVQTLANGGLAALLATWHAIAPSSSLFAAFLGVLATVNADTWATELGSLAVRPPRLITSGRIVPRGTSGGVTGLGVLASAGGALLIAVLAAVPAAWVPLLAPTVATGPLRLVLAVTLGGLAGSLADSLLGATLQVIYRCPVCDSETEHRVHRCGTPTQRLRGLPLLENDLVNLLSSAAGGLIAFTLLR